MNNTSEHVVVVDFSVSADEEDQALHEIAEYIDSFLSKQPGFIVSTLHKGLEPGSILHYARWRSETDFNRAAQAAQSHPELPRMRSFNPHGRGFTPCRSFGDLDLIERIGIAPGD